jgi:flavodoxin/ferredoxin
VAIPTTKEGQKAMKTLIVYFSQTGSTHRIAERIRDGIVEATGSCEMTRLEELSEGTLTELDLIGLGFPVFYFQEPFHVRDFIGALPEQDGRHWFVFCTHGSVMGNALASAAERLKKKGAVVVGTHHTYADGSLPFYPYPTLTTGHPDGLDEEEARAFGREAAERSHRVAEGESCFAEEPEPVAEEWVQAAAGLTPEFLRQVTPPLHIDPEKCTLCHECESNCPVQGIDVEADPPRIQTSCIYCWNCVKTCPTVAIEADWDALVANAPETYARYRRELDKAAARGEFRWLIDPDTLDFDDPLYKQRQRKLEGS